MCLNHRPYFSYFPKPYGEIALLFGEGTGSGKMLTCFRVLGRVTVALYSNKGMNKTGMYYILYILLCSIKIKSNFIYTVTSLVNTSAPIG